MRVWDSTELNRRATVGSWRSLVFLGTLSDGEKGRAMEEEGGWFRPWRPQIARPARPRSWLVGRSSGVRVTPAGIRVRECPGRDMVIVDYTVGQLRKGLALVA